MDVVITLSNATVIQLQQLEAAGAPESTNTRSLWSIIWSCLATLFFCTWVAIHPNSADENETDGAVFVRRLGLMVAMFLAPEMVVCWALRQWVLATYLGEKYKGYPVAVKWRKVHGFFLIMGGFTYYDDDGNLKPLSASKLKELYDNREIEWPTISAKQIRDRSKADVLSKSIVLIQTGWFSLQLLVRLGKGMVVTELEISTFAFALLNLIVYILWLDKPFDVRSHVVVRGVGREPDVVYKPPDSPSVRHTPSLHSLSMQPAPLPTPSLSQTPLSLSPNPSTPELIGTSPDLEKAEEPQSTTPQSTEPQSTFIFLARDLSQRISKSAHRFSRKMKRAFFIVMPCLPHTDSESQVEPKVHKKVNWRRYIVVKAKHIAKQLWKSRPRDLLDALTFYPAFLYGCFISPFFYLYVEKGAQFDAQNDRDLYDVSLDPQSKLRHPWVSFLFRRKAQLAVVSVVGVIFGGVHLIAWPFQFHTDTERWLWRSSSLALIFPPILFQVHTVVFSNFTARFGRSSLIETLFMVFWLLLLLLAAVAYMSARAILIVLPLIALRHAPSGAFMDINWTAHFPHI